MKVAVINTPFSTHIGRMEYVFKALKSQGHEIELWGSGATEAIASHNDFTFRELQLDTDFAQVMQRPLKPHEIFNELFFTMAKQQLPTVLNYCEKHTPDVIEANARVFSSTVASMITGIPVVTHCCSGISFSQHPMDMYGFCIKGTETPRQLTIMQKLSGEFFKATDEWFNANIAQPFNLGAIENAVGLCSTQYALAQSIKELSKQRIAQLPNVHLTGPIVSEMPTSIDFSDFKPYCYVSLGTSPVTIAEIIERYRTVANAIPSQYRVVIGLGRLFQKAFLDIGDHRVTVFEQAPQIEAIKHAEFVVCHGGCQTVHEALYFGKPIIGIPHHAETSEMVNAVELNGAGVRISPAQVNKHNIEEAVARITSDEVMQSARRLATLLGQADGLKNTLQVFNKIERKTNGA